MEPGQSAIEADVANELRDVAQPDTGVLSSLRYGLLAWA